MNTDKLIYRAFNAFKKPNDTNIPENDYTPAKKLKVSKTVYPNGQKQMSLNGRDEWYGIQEAQLKIN